MPLVFMRYDQRYALHLPPSIKGVAKNVGDFVRSILSGRCFGKVLRLINFHFSYHILGQ